MTGAVAQQETSDARVTLQELAVANGNEIAARMAALESQDVVRQVEIQDEIRRLRGASTTSHPTHTRATDTPDARAVNRGRRVRPPIAWHQLPRKFFPLPPRFLASPCQTPMR